MMVELEAKQADMRLRNGAVDPVPQAQEPSVHLVARNPVEMESAKSNLVLWLQQKIRQCADEAKELTESAQTAKKNKWNWKTINAHAGLANRRAEFYRKALLAVDAGYTIVPNFPIDMFAIRVSRSSPSTTIASNSTSSWSGLHPARNPQPESLPIGEGRYVSGGKVVGTSGNYKDKNSKGEEVTKYYFDPTDFADVEFPIACARPVVMSAAAQAMALRCFDAIGICPQTRKGDPLIIGRILGPKVGYTQKEISFLIAWHLDLRTL